MPVNLPSHAHGQGYSDLNFMIPELVAGVQFSKGPYYADQGDFATAGAANINYATSLDRPIAARRDWRRRVRSRAVSPRRRSSGADTCSRRSRCRTTMARGCIPTTTRRSTASLRYSQGDAVNGFALTAMGYHGQWNSTDQVPQRAIAKGLIGRFGTLDPSDGGHTYRYSVSGDWQHGTGYDARRRSPAYGIGYDLDLFSNFTFYLDDPVHGDQHRAGRSPVHHRRER